MAGSFINIHTLIYTLILFKTMITTIFALYKKFTCLYTFMLTWNLCYLKESFYCYSLDDVSKRLCCGGGILQQNTEPVSETSKSYKLNFPIETTKGIACLINVSNSHFNDWQINFLSVVWKNPVIL